MQGAFQGKLGAPFLLWVDCEWTLSGLCVIVGAPTKTRPFTDRRKPIKAS